MASKDALILAFISVLLLITGFDSSLCLYRLVEALFQWMWR